MFLGILFSSCSKKSDTFFTLLDAADTGVTFNNYIEEEPDNNVLRYGYFYNGGGVAAADFNNDGLIDLYFTGNMVSDKLYLNQGKMKFEDITDKAGIKHDGWKTGVSVVDINNDGWLDLYVCRSGAEDPKLRKNLLYINQGTKDVKFVERAADYGLDDDAYTTQAAFFDYDKDGDLDCFLLNHSVQEYAGFSTMLATYRQQTDTRYGCKLLQNNNNKFEDVSGKAGLVNNVLSFGLGLNVSDFNNDGWLDLYVSNDYNENDYLYINQKNGTYKEVIREAMGHTSMYSMGTDAADINNDGFTDIVTLDMLPEPNDRIKLTAGDDNYDKYQRLLAAGFHHQTMRNMLHLNTPHLGASANFSEVGQLAGISNTDWSWAALLADFDNDGLKDLFITNGYARDYTNMEFLKYSTDVQVAQNQGKAMPKQMEIIEQMPAISEPNYIFKNKDGINFEKKIQDWGFEKKSQSNGAVYADLDNDGDLDLVTNNVNDKAFIYQNNATDAKEQAKNFIDIVLQSPHEALKIGAKVTVFSHHDVQSSMMQVQEFQPARGFQSAMYVPLHFGLDKNQVIDSITVIWVDGKVSSLKSPKTNQNIVLNYNSGKTNKPSDFNITPYFNFQNSSSNSSLVNLLPINDFKVQTLLPQMLTGERAAMAKGDVNADGLEDIYIGGERGQTGMLYLQKSSGFAISKQADFEKDANFEDASATFFDADGDKDLDLLIVSAGYALSTTDPSLQPRLYLNEKGTFKRKTPFLNTNLMINASVVKNADIDSDGDQDLFVGGHCISRRYPESNPSVLLKNDGKGNFTISPSFKYNALVTDAAFTDINKDKKPDLMIVGEWAKPTIFLNQNGELLENKELTTNLPNFIAYSLYANDLDKDGDEDFVVGAMGKNNQYHITANEGLKLYYGDFGDNDGIVPLISLLQNGEEYPYASRDEMLDQVPLLKKKYPDYVSYAKATMADIMTDELTKKSKTLSAQEYRTGILWNDNGKLNFESLPTEAQFAPVFAIGSMDVDKDGKQDLILGGNMERTRVRIGKMDANRGQVFLNKGAKKFVYMPQYNAGINISGDIRAIAVANNYALFGVREQGMFVYKNSRK